MVKGEVSYMDRDINRTILEKIQPTKKDLHLEKENTKKKQNNKIISWKNYVKLKN